MPMATSPQEDVFRRLVHRIDPQGMLLCTWRPSGGVSAEITALEVGQAGGGTTTLIARRHGEVDRAHNPHVARDEFRLLQIAQGHGLAAPKPSYVDETCDLFPTPVLVVGYVEGETDFAPADLGGYLSQTAAELVKIHGVKDGPDL